ncbi:DoxX family membrane protein [Actinomadura logoneensis]|uniref:DoxX family membrane protein n=1 Tax=Actinomadura logoneensis TaxID=2293572 RepID=A0A372JEJ9_9ACTN|nr:DoxX family membrane protein [Actinomadura logoneensis]RFU38443.1 DoxX family membrane protein [Actinomadura logoneensis]
MRPFKSPARPLVAAPYIITGLETMRDPRPRAEQVAPALKPIADQLDWLPKDPVTLVRIQGAMSLGTGALLLTGRFRRLATVMAAAQLLPALATEHHYWTEDDPERRASERSHLLKNAALFGALLMVAGAPSRNQHVADLRRQLREAQSQAGMKSKELRRQAASEIKAQRREAMADVSARRREAMAEVKALRRQAGAQAKARRRKAAAGMMAGAAVLKAAQKQAKAAKKKAGVPHRKSSHGPVHKVLAAAGAKSGKGRH